MKRRLTLLTLLVLATSLPLKAAQVAASLSAVKAYPNPWRSDRHSNSDVNFAGMPVGSVVKIFTISAHQVKSLVADSLGEAHWNRANDSGDMVASGVYIFLIIDPAGNSTTGKLAIIK